MSATHQLLRFGVFELNLATEEVRKQGTHIKLAPQPFRLLALLANHSGQVVTREEIHKQLWDDDTFVDFEQGMNKCIKQIRGVLNDNAEKPLYIETIPRHGYRFLAPVVSKVVEAPPPRVTESISGIQKRPEIGIVRDDGSHMSASITGALAVPPPTSVGLSEAAAGVAVASETSNARAPMSARRRARATIAWLGASLISLVAVAFYWQTQKAPALTEKDTIILADFENRTGDPIFDAALGTALAVNLEQSPFLNVLSDARVQEQLRFMGRAMGARVTGEVAREVCQRTSGKAMLLGSISQIGTHYDIVLKAVNCVTGDSLGDVQEEAENRDQILKRLAKASAAMRKKLGESLASVQKYDAPVEQASTASFEALQAYGLGLRSEDTAGEEAAIPLFVRATELDPNFAMAYARLGGIYNNLNQPSLAAENITKAFQLRERTSEREKLYIAGHYHLFVTGDLLKAIETYIVFTQIYPRDTDAHQNLSAAYTIKGSYEEALTEALEALRLDPTAGGNYPNCIALYCSLDRFEEAKTILGKAEAQKIASESLAPNAYTLAFLRNDESEMKRQVANAIGQPDVEAQMFQLQSETATYWGRVAEARVYFKRAIESNLRTASKEAAAWSQMDGALHDAEVGFLQRGSAEAAAALLISQEKGAQILGAIALARSGNAIPARELADQLDRRYPSDTAVRYYWLPTIRAAIELEDKNPERAIEILHTAAPYELGSPSPYIGPLYPVYLRGLAYLKTGQSSQAKTEFRKILDHRGIVQNFVTGALAHLQLGRAEAMSGDKEAARRSYQEFLQLWKGADPDVPILVQAKAEYATLN